MKRIAILVALGFLVLTAATYVGVYLGEQGARANRSEYVARTLLKDYQKGSLPEILSAAQRAPFEQHGDLLKGPFRRLSRRREGDAWLFTYCFSSGGVVELAIPEDGNVEHFEAMIHPPGAHAAPCPAASE